MFIESLALLNYRLQSSGSKFIVVVLVRAHPE